MPKPRTVLGPGILSAALVLSSCGSPNPRIDDLSAAKQGGVAVAAAPTATATASASAIRSDLGGADIEHRSGGGADAP